MIIISNYNKIKLEIQILFRPIEKQLITITIFRYK